MLVKDVGSKSSSSPQNLTWFRPHPHDSQLAHHLALVRELDSPLCLALLSQQLDNDSRMCSHLDKLAVTVADPVVEADPVVVAVGDPLVVADLLLVMQFSSRLVQVHNCQVCSYTRPTTLIRAGTSTTRPG